MEYKKEQCKGIRKDVTIANLSLLNTGWYMRQLRDKEGIKVTLPDNLLDATKEGSPLAPARLDRDYKVTIPGANKDQSFDVILKEGTVMYTKDWAILYLVRDNFGKRPIYFAVTIPDKSVENVGLGTYRRNEGMVDRVVKIDTYNFKLESDAESISLIGDFTDWKPEPMTETSPGVWEKSLRMMPGVYGYFFQDNRRQTILDPNNPIVVKNEMGRNNSVIIADFDIDRLVTNIDSIYQYRSIFDDNVYKDENMSRLVNNYAAAFISRASYYYTKMGQMDKSIDYMEKGVAFIDGKPRVKKALSRLYDMAATRYLDEENYEKAFEILIRQIESDPTQPSPYIEAAMILMEQARIAKINKDTSAAAVNIEEAFKLIENALIISPADEYILKVVSSFAEESKDFEILFQ